MSAFMQAVAVIAVVTIGILAGLLIGSIAVRMWRSR